MYSLVSIVILNWNGKSLLKRSINNALATSYKKKEVIVVDNGSTDGSADYVEKTFGKKIRLVRLKENRGFTGGHNYGFKIAKGKYVFLIPNDVTLPKKCLSPLVAKMTEDESIGAVFPVCYNYFPGTREKVYSYGNIAEIAGHGFPADSDNEFTLTPTGAAIMIKKNKFVEPFIDELFIASDETTIGLKSWLRGLKVIPIKNVKIRHAGSMATRKITGQIIYYTERNGILIPLIFYSIKTIILLSPIYIIEVVLGFLKTVISLNQMQLKNRLVAWVWILTHISKIVSLRKHIRKELGPTNDILALKIMGYGKMKNMGGFRKILSDIYQAHIRFVIKTLY